MSELLHGHSTIYTQSDLEDINGTTLSGAMDIYIEGNLRRNFNRLKHDEILFFKVYKHNLIKRYTGLEIGARINNEYPSFYLIDIYDKHGTYLYNTTLPKR